jgi:hypothetical protein
MLLLGAFMLFTVAGLALGSHFTRRGPELHERLDALLAPYEGQSLAADALRELQDRANTLFRDIVTGAGLLPDDWSVVLELDDVLGPVARLHGPDGLILGVAELERKLRDGTIELPSA